MQKRNIIVIGASAGGFEAIKTIVANLPSDLDASLFIVWHIAPTVHGILPQVLRGLTHIPVAHAVHNEPILTNRIYIAPPDHHMILEKDRVLVTRGPKENRFRPAVDPLFRSAAYAFGSRVIGVILSGALDDGTAGLWIIKHRGGLAVVQDPADAQVPSMPENAIREVATDYVVPVAQLPSLLTRLADHEIPDQSAVIMEEDSKLKAEVRIAAQDDAFAINIQQYGELSPFACPECHGVLTRLKEDHLVRFRCHTGHAYSADVLLASITEKIEDSLYSTMRGMDESIMLLDQLGDHFAEANQPRMAAQYFQQARQAQERTGLVRQALQLHQQLNEDTIEHPEAYTQADHDRPLQP
jgi:two-component system chemotaxis response regulator CheB